MAILGISLFTLLGLFPTLLSVYPPCLQKRPYSTMTKRTASAAFPAVPSTEAVALSPTQFHQLEMNQPIIPDLFSERFGLRSDRLKALERAHYFTNWVPPHEAQDAGPPIHQKQFVLCKLLITVLGYMTLCEEGILVKGDGRDHFRPGYYQWYGPLYKKRWSTDGKKETLLWTIEDGYEMIS